MSSLRYIHISDNAKVGKNVSIGNFSSVYECTLEDNVLIGDNCSIYGGAHIRRNTKVWHNSNVYGCLIGEDTQIGSMSVIKPGANI